MMCFEVILEIIIAFFAVFGLYSVIVFIGETWFTSDNVRVCIEVDTNEAATEIDSYLKSVNRKPLAHGGNVMVLIRRPYASESLLRKLRCRHIRYYVIDMEKEVK